MIMKIEKKSNYTLDYILKITNIGNEILFNYKNKNYIIFWKRDEESVLKLNRIFQKNPKGKFCIGLVTDNENEIQKFDTAKELYENAIINGKKIIDIWEQINITDILGIK